MASVLVAVKMPKWGLSMEEGKIVQWCKSEGEQVQEGEDLVDIETTKITNTAEAPATGILRRVLSAPDETRRVGALLGVIAEAATPDEEIERFIEEFSSHFATEALSAVEEESLILRNVETSRGRIQLGMTSVEPALETVVLIHGFSSDLNNWLFNIDALKAVARVVAVDLPGHGGSTKEPGDSSLEALAQATMEAIAQVGVERAHFVGHSLGAAVAVQAALEAPSSVQSLTLIAPPGILGGKISRAFLDGIVEAQRSRDLRSPLEMLVDDPTLIGKAMMEDVMKAKRLDGAEDWLRALSDRMVYSAELNDLRARLSEIPRALVIASRNDQVVGQIDEAALPKTWRLEWIDQAGHMPHLEKSSDVNRLLLAEINNN